MVVYGINTDGYLVVSVDAMGQISSMLDDSGLKEQNSGLPD